MSTNKTRLGVERVANVRVLVLENIRGRGHAQIKIYLKMKDFTHRKL